MTPRALRHRIANGRLHPVHAGVYAVGRPELGERGRWMAAVLRCGPEAVLSHSSAAALWRIRDHRGEPVEVSVPDRSRPRAPRIRVHRRAGLEPADLSTRDRIPITSPVRTLVDLAGRLGPRELEAAVSEADRLDLIDPEALRAAIDALAGTPGVGPLRSVLDRRTFRLTDSELERCFLPIARRVGLPLPLTGHRVNGFKVDFFWPDLSLVVETDGLRYHRTSAPQARDRVRDQVHTAAGLTQLRFTHAQMRFEARHVERTLVAVVRRLSP